MCVCWYKPWTEWITFFGKSLFCLSSFYLNYNKQIYTRVSFSTMEESFISWALPFTASNAQTKLKWKLFLILFGFKMSVCVCACDSKEKWYSDGLLPSRKTFMSVLIKSSHIINGWKMLSKGMQKKAATTTKISYASMVATAPLFYAHSSVQCQRNMKRAK